MRIKTLFRNTALLIVLLLAFASNGVAQDRIAPPLITVSGQAEILVVPDEVVFNLTVETLDKDLEAARFKTDQTVKILLDLGRKYDIPASQMQTGEIRLEKRFSSEELTRKPSVFLGFAVIKKVALILRDVSKSEKLLADIFRAGVSEINSVEFRTTQLRRYKDQARALAIKAAQEKAIALTKEIGQSIGKAYSISEMSYPNSGMSNYINTSRSVSESFSDDESTIALGQISIEARVMVSFELK
jgi:uncharacterized protein